MTNTQNNTDYSRNHRWDWNIGHVMIAISMVVSTLSVGFGVYMNLNNTITEMAFKVNFLSARSDIYDADHTALTQNTSNIMQLQKIAENLSQTNSEMLRQLTGIRVDLAKIQGRDDIRENDGLTGAH